MTDTRDEIISPNTYEDIISLPHPDSPNHPRMPMSDRAAQFSPFAALTGYDAAISEAARRTDQKIEPDEYALSSLNEKLQIIAERMNENMEVTITYFLPDGKKAGGAYVAVAGVVKKIDDYERVLVMCDGTRIPIDDILEIDTSFTEGEDPFS